MTPHMFGYAVCVLCVIQANTVYGCCRCIPGVAVWYMLCGYSHMLYGTVWLYAWVHVVCAYVRADACVLVCMCARVCFLALIRPPHTHT